ncbi:MAG: class I SAM-dependent methyltransferase [Verrucomicrobiota bacterium]
MSIKFRKVTEELLDHLPADDPQAIQSRRDLERINFVLGNFRWLNRQLRELGARRIVEIGAGDAQFACSFAEANPDIDYIAIDLAPKPKSTPENLDWLQGDLFEQLPNVKGDVLVANLFLHHLEEKQLNDLGQQLPGFRAVLSSDPARFRVFHAGGYALRIFGLNEVTKHDLHVSIDAGFRNEELPTWLGLNNEDWAIQTRHTMLGMYRMIAVNQRYESAD